MTEAQALDLGSKTPANYLTTLASSDVTANYLNSYKFGIYDTYAQHYNDIPSVSDSPNTVRAELVITEDANGNPVDPPTEITSPLALIFFTVAADGSTSNHLVSGLEATLNNAMYVGSPRKALEQVYADFFPASAPGKFDSFIAASGTPIISLKDFAAAAVVPAKKA